jgi:hypothetical protein
MRQAVMGRVATHWTTPDGPHIAHQTLLRGLTRHDGGAQGRDRRSDVSEHPSGPFFDPPFGPLFGPLIDACFIMAPAAS